MMRLWLTNPFARFSALMVSRVLGAASAFLLNILVARELGLAALGYFAVFQAAVAIVASLAPLGLTAPAPAIISACRTEARFDLIKGYVLAATAHIGIVGLLMALVVILVWNFALGIVIGDHLVLTVCALQTGIGVAVLNLNGAVMSGLKRQVSGLIPETMLRPLLNLAAVGGAFLFAAEVSLSSVFVIVTTGTWLAVLSAFLLSLKNLSTIVAERAAFDYRRWRRTGYPWLVISLAWDYSIDILILVASVLTGAVEVAILHACFRYRVLAGFGLRSIYALTIPDIAEYKSRNNQPELCSKIMRANLAGTVYSLAVMGIFSLGGSTLLSLFSIVSDGAVPILLIIAASLLVRSVLGPAPMVLMMHDINFPTALVSVAGLALALLAVFLFLPDYGLLVAAIAYSGANLLTALALWLYARWRIGIDCSLFAGLKKLPGIPKLEDSGKAPT